MTRIAILRCGKLPSFVNWEIPNLEELFEEDHLLLRGFASQGWQAEPVVWNDPNVDWNQFDIALIRSTWDYLDEQEQFLQVLAQIESSSCKLYNPVDAVRWNINKRYLFGLEQWGIPIIPTALLSDVKQESLEHLFPGLSLESVVLKPTIGLGGSHSVRVPVQGLEDRLATIITEPPQHEYLIQPFIESVISEGEWSFVYFHRELSHVLLKRPAPNDYRVQGIYGGTIQPADPSSQDLLHAEAVISRIPFDILYARLDFVRVNGTLSVIEVELIEPIFSFNLVPQSVERLVNATRIKFSGNA